MRNKILNILLIIFVATAFCGCSIHRHKKINVSGAKRIVLDAQQEQNGKIKVEDLQNRLIKLKITIPAQFKAVDKYLDRIYAPIDGKVVKVFVEPGSIVKQGQPLALIKSDAIGQMQLEFLDKYIDVDSNIKQMSAQYNLSLLSYRRENTLFHEGISSRAEYEVARAQMLKDKANLDSLKVQKRTIIRVYAQRVALYGGSESSITRAAATKKIYPYVTMSSNKSGIVLERKVNPGEVIDQNKDLFSVAKLSTIWLVGYAFEKDAPLLKIGQDVVGKLEDNASNVVTGKLSYVSSVLDPERKTLEVRADIPNENFSIKPNMYAEMIVNVGNINALAVPNSALQKYGDYTFAFVRVAPHTYEERKVIIGQYNDKYSEVKSGLKQGEAIVSSGAFALLGESIKSREE